MVKVTRDGKTVAEVETGSDAFIWLLRHQGQSVNYALRYGGYNVLDADGTELPEVAEYRRN